MVLLCSSLCAGPAYNDGGFFLVPEIQPSTSYLKPQAETFETSFLTTENSEETEGASGFDKLVLTVREGKRLT